MGNDILNNAYVVGIGTRNLVLNTLGRVYVKNQDRYYELSFKENSIQTVVEDLSDIIISSDVQNLDYPGDNKLIITPDGQIYYTENGIVVEFKINSSAINWEIQDFTINGTLTIITENESPPLIINSSTLVKNLNAQYLNGFSDTAFTKKAVAEAVTGSWEFKNKITFSSQTVTGSISNDKKANPTVLDFAKSTLDIDYINVRKGINFPTDEETPPIIDSVGGELWVGNKFIIEKSEEVSEWQNNYPSTIENAYTEGYLPQLFNTGDIDNDETESLLVWYQVYFSNWYPGAEDDGLWIPQIRNLSDQNEVNYVNTTYLNVFGIDVVDKLFVYYNFYNEDPLFTASVIKVNLKGTIRYGDIFVNSKVKDSANLIEGHICNIIKNTLYICLNVDDATLPAENSYLNIITNSVHKGGIVLNALDNNKPFIDVITSYPYNWEATDEDDKAKLLDNNNIISRTGNLDGLVEDGIFGTLKGVGTLLQGKSQFDLDPVIGDVTKNNILAFAKNNHSRIFIKDPNICFGEYSLINPDGSGYIGNGKIRWAGQHVVLEKVKMFNSTFDQQTFVDSSLIAGGDLVGTYPNPQIKKTSLPTNIFKASIVARDGLVFDDCFCTLTLSTNGTLFSTATTRTGDWEIPYDPYDINEGAKLLGTSGIRSLFPNDSAIENKLYTSVCNIIPSKTESITTQVILHIPNSIFAALIASGTSFFDIDVTGSVYGVGVSISTTRKSVGRFIHLTDVFDMSILNQATKDHILLTYQISKG